MPPRRQQTLQDGLSPHDAAVVRWVFGHFVDDPAFEEFVADLVRRELEAADEETIVGVTGVAALFGFMRVSKLMEMVEDSIRGRLLVFFPGEYEDNNYRLLDARDGWNYHAVPITATAGLSA